MNWNPIAALIKPLADGVTNVMTTRSETKVAMRKIKSGEVLTALELQLVTKKLEAGTWKDEYITLVVTAPMVVMMIGAITAPDVTLFEASQIMMKQFNLLDTDAGYGEILLLTIGAGLGLRLFKK